MDTYKTTALIGFTGFVGSNLYFDYKFTDVYNSKNINDIVDKTYDCVICAGISAVKWYANINPEKDLEDINKLLNILDTVRINKFVLISTIDIYDDVNAGLDEDYVPDINYNNHSYGKNRLYVENVIKNKYSDYLIVRLPGLFGFGLKKNIIFDYLNKKLNQLNLQSTYQWYDVSNLFKDVDKIINNNIKIVNLFTEPISNGDLIEIFKKYDDKSISFVNDNIINYDMMTKHTTSGYFYNKKEILIQLETYINTMKNNQLIVSNLSWKHNNNMLMLSQLQNYGINSLEIAPYKYFGNTVDRITNINKELPIYSFQALLYPLLQNIFNSGSERSILMKYLTKMINIASELNVKILVFGSPKNRQKKSLTHNEALDIAIPFFRILGDYAYSKNIIICIEPNAKIYDCDFITNSMEGRDLILKVNSKGFGLHLDVGCMALEHENIIEYIKHNLDILKHIHFSAPHLTQLSNFKQINYNELLIEIIKIYSGKIGIEMLNCDDYDVIKNVRYCLRL